ncbi:uncharacterized protein LOC113500224 [Trichoplusia ni]|uniref:Uncharacterized protein LOC113500224 n=1 Tax=Trichoplusia ni TaxID=7111 RepID=A0A7E5W7X9_TRINI|nr:uncharacterized protein LOC113500224 [Trichoplusia ni]
MAFQGSPALTTASGKCVLTTATETGGGRLAVTEVPELAAITVTSRIPEFWTNMPRLWFNQFECVMAQQKQGDESKYNLVVSKLDMDVLQQVSDILRDPPAQDKYSTLKQRLISVYEESAEQQFRKLVSEIELGSQKPSQLLRKMADLGRNPEISGQALCNLWLAKLPAAVRAGLAVTQEKDLEKLATIADKIVENLNANTIAAVCSDSVPSAPSCSNQVYAVGDLLTQINKLSLEVASLKNEIEVQGHRRNSFRGRGRGRWNARSRSRSRDGHKKMNAEDPNWLCKYHFRYRTRARNCEKPCAWIKKKEN